MLVVAVVVAVLVSPIPTLTWQATAVTAAIGVVGAVLAASGRLGRVGGRRRVTVRSATPWGVLVVAVLALEIGALLYGYRPDFPTISYLLGPEFVDRTVRLVGYVAWICGGYWLARR
ncbi:hypothetical protein GCM10023215_26310 [Pseudonocardia yuanmonensis]|uniref:Uncharacterized protein n=1 Tax=Pseudonocardia yuanmonensis TaxID=1095914 RepID=A0ABP8WFU6_9PSEU